MRAGEHGRVLLDVADLGAELVAVERADVDAAEPDDAGRRVVEALDEREDRALAGAGRADEGGALAARHGEARRRAARCGRRGAPVVDVDAGLLGVARSRTSSNAIAARSGRLRRRARPPRRTALAVALDRQVDDLLDAAERAERRVDRGDRAEAWPSGMIIMKRKRMNDTSWAIVMAPVATR